MCIIQITNAPRFHRTERFQLLSEGRKRKPLMSHTDLQMATGRMDESLAPGISALLSEHDEAQADIALAQMLQEQEDAWFAQGLILPTHHTEISQQGARRRSGNEQRCDTGPGGQPM